MGGQIVYDALTSFLPGDPDPVLRDARIDFWCATASQVGFFEEAKLFLASKATYKTGHEVPFPQAHLGVWWNVWDHNDFLSYTVKNIVNGVMDESFDSGMSLIEAHGGYVRRPSFFRRKIAQALRQHLPHEYAKAAEILIASLDHRPRNTAGQSMASFLFLPHVLFVADYGLEHFEVSMQAQYVLTKLFTAEFSIRRYLERHPEATLARLTEWAGDSSAVVPSLPYWSARRQG